jgi:hypothetical protein
VVQGAQDNNVVPMPGVVNDQAPLAPTADVAPPTDRWKGLAEPGTPAEALQTQIPRLEAEIASLSTKRNSSCNSVTRAQVGLH